MARPQVLLELLVRRAIVRLKSVVKDYVGVATRAVRHVVEGGGLFAGDRVVHWLVLEVVKGVPRLTALVITELVQTSICESYISIATRAITGVCHVLGMVRSVNSRCVYHMSVCFCLLYVISSFGSEMSCLVLSSSLMIE